VGRDHGISSDVELHEDAAEDVARVMQALATPSRVRILGRLRQGPCSVGELAEAVSMAQPAVSHQLRILRDLSLVVRTRDGRHRVYDLFDPHVSLLIDEALRHVAHLRAGTAEPPNLQDRNQRAKEQ